MARINKTRYAILGMLTLRPMSGYDIKKSMQRSTNYFWMESDGQLYPILRQLEQETLVKVKKEMHGARARKVYSLTKKGREALVKWFTMPNELPVLRSELMLKLFFGQHASKGVNIKHLENYRRELCASKERCEMGIKHLKTEHKDDLNQPYWLMTVRRGFIVTDAMIKWCDETLASLKRLQKK
jgi:PadR family transcriptional regulator AphA